MGPAQRWVVLIAVILACAVDILYVSQIIGPPGRRGDSFAWRSTFVAAFIAVMAIAAALAVRPSAAGWRTKGSAAPAVALPLGGRFGSLFLPVPPPLALAGSGGGGGLLATQFSLPLVGRVGEGVLRRLHSLPTLDLRSRS